MCAFLFDMLEVYVVTESVVRFNQSLGRITSIKVELRMPDMKIDVLRAKMKVCEVDNCKQIRVENVLS